MNNIDPATNPRIDSVMQSVRPGVNGWSGEAARALGTDLVFLALDENAQELSLEMLANTARAFIRVDGRRMLQAEMTADAFENVLLFLLELFPDGHFFRFEYSSFSNELATLGERRFEAFFQSLPVYPDGLDVVLKIRPFEKPQPIHLETLGYAPDQVRMLVEAVSKKQGLVVVAGTCGSGVTTTLRSLINEAAGGDPQNPDRDVFVLDSLRSKSGAAILEEAARSGMALASFNASSALVIVDRLQDFNIDRARLTEPEFLAALVYQKLFPVLCDGCSVPFSEGASASGRALGSRIARVLLDSPGEHNIRVAGAGCPKCQIQQFRQLHGYSGRTACAEVIVADADLLSLFAEETLLPAKMHWRRLADKNNDSDETAGKWPESQYSSGEADYPDILAGKMAGKTILGHALQKMRAGVISPFDIEELLGPVDGDVTSMEVMLRHELETRASVDNGASTPNIN